MKKYLFLTYGFETPTKEIMDAWGKWFESIKENIVQTGIYTKTIDLKNSEISLKSGIYFCIVKSMGKTRFRKIILK